MSTATETFDRGSRLLNSGHTLEALAVFEGLAAAPKPSWDVMNHLGITHRLLGNHAKAARAFGRAYECAETDRQKGQTMRDWSMVPLQQKRFDDAKACLSESLELLRGRDNAVEYAVTLGFVGRLELLRGDREAARSYMQLADIRLRSGAAPDIYILNNLVWWMKTVGPVKRFQLIRRALPLAKRHGNSRRIRELCVVLASPRLAALLHHH